MILQFISVIKVCIVAPFKNMVSDIDFIINVNVNKENCHRNIYNESQIRLKIYVDLWGNHEKENMIMKVYSNWPKAFAKNDHYFQTYIKCIYFSFVN